jgi:phosphoserine phosphatase RsbU/P
MSRWNVIVVARVDDAAVARNLWGRIVADWPRGAAPTADIATLGPITPDRLESLDAAVIIAHPLVERTATLGFLAALEQAGVPALAVGDAAADMQRALEFAGALCLKGDTSEQVLAATLLGLLHRQRDVRQLQKDLAIAQRFHGGLEGEISRMHEELQLAAMVQRELLPRQLPSVHGVSFAAMWRPTNYVSGDIYDVARLDEDHVGVFLADAVGHGVPAALMTMVISRSVVLKEITGESYRLLPPAEVLERLNSDMMHRRTGSTRFATAVYALINCRERTCRLAGAGHPAPVRLRPDGRADLLETSGGLLGIFADERYEEIEFDLDTEDRIVFYSDGFEQAFPSPGASATGDRLRPTTAYRDEFRRLAQLEGPGEMVANLRHRLDSQHGSLHQIDDLTLVCMHVGAPTRSATQQANSLAL